MLVGSLDWQWHYDNTQYSWVRVENFVISYGCILGTWNLAGWSRSSYWWNMVSHMELGKCPLQLEKRASIHLPQGWTCRTSLNHKILLNRHCKDRLSPFWMCIEMRTTWKYSNRNKGMKNYWRILTLIYMSVRHESQLGLHLRFAITTLKHTHTPIYIHVYIYTYTPVYIYIYIYTHTRILYMPYWRITHIHIQRRRQYVYTHEHDISQYILYEYI